MLLVKRRRCCTLRLFQWAPTLGGECYQEAAARVGAGDAPFQWAPTLGGECYSPRRVGIYCEPVMFQWAPTLGGECY